MIHDGLSSIPGITNYPSLVKHSSSVLASILTALMSLPADNIKVKLQKSLKGDGDYKGILDCLMKTVRREGVLKLWVGLPVYVIRGVPHSFILITVNKYLSELLK